MVRSWVGRVLSTVYAVSGMFFFFKQKTAYEMVSDWSSDVCSSDLVTSETGCQSATSGRRSVKAVPTWGVLRSEERRVGKSVDLGGRRIIKKKKRGKI